MAAAKKQCFLRFLYLTESSPASFKVRSLQMTINLALVKVHVSSRHSNLNFAHHFVIYWLFQNAWTTWTLRKRDQDRLLSFEMSCLRRSLGISRRDRIRNDNIRQKLDLETTIMDRIHSRRLTYHGHIIRMCNNRLPLITLFGSTSGTRPKGRPPKRWIDCCKESCQMRGIVSLTDARWLIQDRQKWRTFSSSSHLDRA